MFTTANIPTLASGTRDFQADQTTDNLAYMLGSPVFSVEGLGVSTSSSIIVQYAAGGFADQLVTISAKYVAPTASPSEEFGVLARYFTDEGGRTYYYARLDGGLAKLSKVVAGSFTTMQQATWAVPQDEFVTISLECVGGALVGTFTSPSQGEVVLPAADVVVPTGLVGFRSLSSTCIVRSLSWQQI